MKKKRELKNQGLPLPKETPSSLVSVEVSDSKELGFAASQAKT